MQYRTFQYFVKWPSAQWGALTDWLRVQISTVFLCFFCTFPLPASPFKHSSPSALFLSLPTLILAALRYWIMQAFNWLAKLNYSCGLETSALAFAFAKCPLLGILFLSSAERKLQHHQQQWKPAKLEVVALSSISSNYILSVNSAIAVLWPHSSLFLRQVFD